jgi:hypothetical protein
LIKIRDILNYPESQAGLIRKGYASMKCKACISYRQYFCADAMLIPATATSPDLPPKRIILPSVLNTNKKNFCNNANVCRGSSLDKSEYLTWRHCVHHQYKEKGGESVLRGSFQAKLLFFV